MDCYNKLVFNTFADALIAESTLESKKDCTYTIEKTDSGKFKIVAYSYVLDLFLDIITLGAHYFYKRHEATSLLSNFHIQNITKKHLTDGQMVNCHKTLLQFIQRWGCSPKERVVVRAKEDMDIELSHRRITQMSKMFFNDLREIQQKSLKPRENIYGNLREAYHVDKTIDFLIGCMSGELTRINQKETFFPSPFRFEKMSEYEEGIKALKHIKRAFNDNVLRPMKVLASVKL